MRDILPDFVVNVIRDRYLAGVSDAQAKYKYNAADEDALTGALGSELSTPAPLHLHHEGRDYQVEIGVFKTRGKGKGAPEKTDGNDGIFQMEVRKDGKLLRRKGLPFQAKNKWKGSKTTLTNQCKNMQKKFKAGIAVNYHPDSYSACGIEDVIKTGGSKRQLNSQNALRPLGQVLGNDFLDCTNGQVGLFFDPQTTEYLPFPTWVMTTQVESFGTDD